MAVETRQKRTARERLAQAKLYAVTCPSSRGETYGSMALAALKGGADIIQLREKGLPAREIFGLARDLKKICESYDALFILNDRLDVALAAGADGVHLGQDDLPVQDARKLVSRPDFLIGCSTHSLEQARAAVKDGADYLGCGPVFSTPTKPDYEAQGLELVREYRRHIEIPFVAIGGIDEANVELVKNAGARCVAAVRAVFDREDIESAARSLKAKFL